MTAKEEGDAGEGGDGIKEKGLAAVAERGGEAATQECVAWQVRKGGVWQRAAVTFWVVAAAARNGSGCPSVFCGLRASVCSSNECWAAPWHKITAKERGDAGESGGGAKSHGRLLWQCGHAALWGGVGAWWPGRARRPLG